MPEDPSVYFGYGYHGTGVNSATWSGRELARWLAGKPSQKIYCQNIYPLSCRGVHPDSRLLFCAANTFALVWVFTELRDYFDI